MRDIGGFLILILILFTLLYLIVRFAVPLALIYAGGLVAFFPIAATMLRRGRRHPIHFDCFLRRRHAAGIAISAVVIPALYVGVLWLFGRRDHLPILAIANGAPPVIWAAWILTIHRSQSKEYHRDGHDVEEKLEEAESRAGLLDLKIELVGSAGDADIQPEPWEYEAGIAQQHDGSIMGRIGLTVLEMKQLRDEYLRLADELRVTLARIRETGRRDKGALVPESTLHELDSAWSRLSREAALIINERVGYTYTEWDEAS
jgi:hypothetical protein